MKYCNPIPDMHHVCDASFVKELNIPEHALSQQYRMHPKIREFISQSFYPDIHPPLQESSELAAQRPRPAPQG